MKEALKRMERVRENRQLMAYEEKKAFKVRRNHEAVMTISILLPS